MTKKKTSRASSRRSGASKSSRSTRRTVRKSPPKRRSQGKRGKAAGWQASLQLSPARKKDILGLILILISLLTFWGMYSQGEIFAVSAWTQVLQKGFGWGTLAIPALLLFVGGWVVSRRFRDPAKRIDEERWIGSAMLYLALLLVLQAAIETGDSAAALPETEASRGGGVVGATLLSLLVRGLGVGGTAVLLLVWLLIGITLTAGITLPQLLGWAWDGLSSIRQGLGGLFRKVFRSGPRSPLAGEGFPDPKSATGTEASMSVGLSGKGETIPAPDAVGQKATEQVRIAVSRDAAGAPWSIPEAAMILESGRVGKADKEFDRQRGRLIESTLESFGAPARVVEINRGPTITQFGLEPDFVEGRSGRRTKVKVAKLTSLADDLALALAASSVRVEAPVPGKGFVGIEVPNSDVTLVALRDVMETDPFRKTPGQLRLALGQDVSGMPIAANLASMPHLLVAGTTGSGKSVCINAIIACLLLQNTPDDLRLMMVDPKRVELTGYNGVPHLLVPVVVELERVVPALQWLSREMDERYRRFALEGQRNLVEYNRHMQVTNGKQLPYLVVVIDELADLMMLAPDETERVITRLAQMARATGIHLIISTQRPSVDVVTGLIKANFPARIAFAVASSVDSRVILDQPGAERLLGRGDMLFQAPDAAAPVRLQGAFVSEDETERLIRYWKNAALGGEPTRPSSAVPASSIPTGAALKQTPLWDEGGGEDGDLDELYDQAVAIVRQMHRASISLLQRRLRIGYTRSARLVDQLEAKGIVGPAQTGSQPREVLDYGGITPEEEE